jgi:hypothetical protein
MTTNNAYNNTNPTLETFGTGIQLPTTGGTPTTLNYYEAGTFTLTLSGIWSASQTGTVRFVRIGNLVTLTLPTIQATQNTSAIITMSGIPSRFLPSVSCGGYVRVKDVGALISTPGWIDFVIGSGNFIYKDDTGLAFSGSGIGGLEAGFVSYSI